MSVSIHILLRDDVTGLTAQTLTCKSQVRLTSLRLAGKADPTGSFVIASITFDVYSFHICTTINREIDEIVKNN
jgi:hypothetical protein